MGSGPPWHERTRHSPATPLTIVRLPKGCNNPAHARRRLFLSAPATSPAAPRAAAGRPPTLNAPHAAGHEPVLLRPYTGLCADPQTGPRNTLCRHARFRLGSQGTLAARRLPPEPAPDLSRGGNDWNDPFPRPVRYSTDCQDYCPDALPFTIRAANSARAVP